MADTKAKGKGKKKSETKQPSAASIAKRAAAEKAAAYQELFAMRQARDDARAEVLRAEFRLNRVLNIQSLSGKNLSVEEDEVRRALNAAREEASYTSQVFEVTKFAGRSTRW